MFDLLFPLVAAAVVGLCVGSFLNVVIHRVPKMLERGWQVQCAELRGEKRVWFVGSCSEVDALVAEGLPVRVIGTVGDARLCTNVE